MVAEAVARAGPRAADAVLGIIPAGTANILAREWGLQGGLSDAAETALVSGVSSRSTRWRPPGGSCSRRWVGSDAYCIRDTSRDQQPAKLGRLAYVISFARLALRHRPRRFTLTVDGSPVRVLAWQVVAANVGTVGAPPFTWGPRMDPTDGVLDLCVFDIRTSPATLPPHVAHPDRSPARRLDSILPRARGGGDRHSAPRARPGGRRDPRSHPHRSSCLREAVRVVVARSVDEVDLAPALPPGAGQRIPRSPSPGRAPSERGGGCRDDDRSGATRTWVLQGVLPAPRRRARGARRGALPPREPDEPRNRLRPPAHRRVPVHALRRRLDPRHLRDHGHGLETRTSVAVQILPVLWLTLLTVNLPLKRLFRRRRPFLALVKARVLGLRPRTSPCPRGTRRRDSRALSCSRSTFRWPLRCSTRLLPSSGSRASTSGCITRATSSSAPLRERFSPRCISGRGSSCSLHH